MIIWSGWGFLVAVIVFGASLTMEFWTEAVFRDDRFYQNHAWPLALALALSGGIIWTLGKYLHARSARIVIDKATGQELTIATRHTFFFISMRYWGPLLLALSILPLVVR
jgi:fucose 4-O-acetylase-like acetyltransferase